MSFPCRNWKCLSLFYIHIDIYVGQAKILTISLQIYRSIKKIVSLILLLYVTHKLIDVALDQTRWQPLPWKPYNPPGTKKTAYTRKPYNIFIIYHHQMLKSCSYHENSKPFRGIWIQRRGCYGKPGAEDISSINCYMQEIDVKEENSATPKKTALMPWHVTVEK